MAVIWERRAASAEDVREALKTRHPMKESTTRTVLKRLEEKGYLEHRVEGRTNIYTGRDAPDHVAASGVRQLIDRFCGGSVERLLIGMVDNNVVDQQELKRLAQRIADRKSQKEER
jgi:predicted transcriptional regulator